LIFEQKGNFSKKIGPNWSGQGCARNWLRPHPGSHQSAPVFLASSFWTEWISIPLTINFDSQRIRVIVCVKRGKNSKFTLSCIYDKIFSMIMKDFEFKQHETWGHYGHIINAARHFILFIQKKTKINFYLFFTLLPSACLHLYYY
jgi:hypothetical protein